MSVDIGYVWATDSSVVRRRLTDLGISCGRWAEAAEVSRKRVACRTGKLVGFELWSWSSRGACKFNTGSGRNGFVPCHFRLTVDSDLVDLA